MPAAEKTPTAEATEQVKQAFATRDDWLNAAGHLREATHEVEGIGLLLLSEITGTARAQILSQQSVGLLAEGAGKRIDAGAYQRTLLLAGVVDPNSPEGARTPLFAAGDIDRVMKIGGAKLATVIDKIEELSALGNYQKRAEENSAGSPNGDGTSG